MENVIRVNMCGTHNKLTQALYQYDYGQVLLVEGISLPETYEVHFANERDGETITVIGTSEGAEIPDALLETGKDITAYIYLHEAETDGETEYVIRIPVHNRPRPADFEPTEEEEITIASLLAAMNNAIEHASQSAQDAAESAEAAEEAIGSYDEMTAEASDLPHGSQPTSVIDRTGDHPVLRLGIPEGAQGRKGDPGNDGYSLTVTVTDITDGHRITITDKQGEHVFDVMNGGKGDKGDPGDDGFSPTVTVTNITGGHRVTITDAQGDHTFDVMDGQGGAVTSVNGETGAVVLDGTKINVNNSAQTQITVKDALDSYNRALTDKLNSPQTAGTNGQVLTSDGQGGQSWQTPSGGGGVSDVQVNGTSIVQSGVANVPKGGYNAMGVYKLGANTYGLEVVSDELRIIGANDNQIRDPASNILRPIIPSQQHKSAFYGLAKAAGDSTQPASSNAVGTYTESAKSAISQMLDAPETVSGTTPSIPAKAGVSYICGECSTLSITLPSSGCIDVLFNSGSTATVLTVTPPTGWSMKWANSFDPTSLESNTTYEVNILMKPDTNECIGVVGSWT